MNQLTIFALPMARLGDNRPQQGRRTQLILPVSGCGANASVRVLSNLFPARAPANTRPDQYQARRKSLT
jgi:hypothetical protein